MAYRFVRTSSSFIEFAIAPLSGYTLGPFTYAIFCKFNETFDRDWFFVTQSSGAYRAGILNSGTQFNWVDGNGSGSSGSAGTVEDAVNWLLIVVTSSGAGVKPRFHVHNGTSWNHADGATNTISTAIVSGDKLRLASRVAGDHCSMDIVCAGIKKANSSDSTVQTLSRTAFAAWATFGFDWLVGCNTSLEAAGVLQDQASPGTGDEVSRSAVTTGVSDPPSWSWVTSTTWNGSSTVSLTDTVTTAGARLGVTTNGSSTTTETVAITTASRAATLHASTAVSETVTVTTRAALSRMTLAPRAPGSLVLVPRPPDSLVLTPR